MRKALIIAWSVIILAGVAMIWLYKPPPCMEVYDVVPIRDFDIKLFNTSHGYVLDDGGYYYYLYMGYAKQITDSCELETLHEYWIHQ